jgi:hypothetical protein
MNSFKCTTTTTTILAMQLNKEGQEAFGCEYIAIGKSTTDHVYNYNNIYIKMIYEITTGLEKIKQIILINRKDWIKNILQSKIIFNKKE